MATTYTSPRGTHALPDLAAIRRAKGISLREISEATKIGTRYLEAIEASQFDKLPGGVFSTSYIRQYARAIDYDEWDLLASYDSTVSEEPAEPPRPRGLLGGVLRTTMLRLLLPVKRV
jgi:cytoskeletal protein RodZ